jgi:hypothetical protein
LPSSITTTSVAPAGLEAPAGGDEHLAGHPVLRDPVGRAQRRDARDARDDAVVDADLVEHRDRRVIHRRVAPDDERPDPVLRRDGGPPRHGSRGTPGLHRGGVVGGLPVPARLLHMHRAGLGRIPRDELVAGGREVRRRAVEGEDDVGAPQRTGRRHRDVLGVTGAHAHDQDLVHGRARGRRR